MLINTALLSDIEDFHTDCVRIKKAFQQSYDSSTDIYSQNITAASFFVISFSIFEDTVKELFKSYIQYLISEFSTIIIPEKIFISHVSAAANSLKNMANQTNISSHELLKISKNLILCSKKSSLFRPDADSICSFQNNINFEEINKMCKNIGISNFKKKFAAQKNIQSYYRSNNIDYIAANIANDLDLYKKHRKRMVHLCSFRSGVGSDYVYRYIKFSRRIILNLALVLSNEIKYFEVANLNRDNEP